MLESYLSPNIRSFSAAFYEVRKKINKHQGFLRHIVPGVPQKSLPFLNQYISDPTCIFAYLHTFILAYMLMLTGLIANLHTFKLAYLCTGILVNLNICILAYKHTCILAYLHPYIITYLHTYTWVHEYFHTCIIAYL